MTKKRVLTSNKPKIHDFSTRRQFLQTTAGAIAISSLINACDKESVTEPDGGDDNASGTDPNDGSNNNTNNNNSGTAPSNRVVRVVDSSATTWDGDNPSDFYQYADQTVVDGMMEKGILALTAKNDIEEAWKSLIDYKDGELVVLHINAYINGDNSKKNNVSAPISAIVYGLVDVLGIPAENIAVVDPSRSLQNSPAQERIINGCRYSDSIQWDRGRGEKGSIIEFTDGHAPPAEERLAAVIEEADHLIMVPVLSWHGFNWITGAMKMMMGSISDMGALHSASMGDWKDGAALADICMPFKNTVRLLVGDGLFGNIEGNSASPHAFQTLGGDDGKHPSSTLYLSRDMVALDCIMYDDLLDEARAANRPKSGHKWGYLSYAADDDHKIGTFEMREETGKDSYSLIDLVEISS